MLKVLQEDKGSFYAVRDRSISNSKNIEDCNKSGHDIGIEDYGTNVGGVCFTVYDNFGKDHKASRFVALTDCDYILNTYNFE
uniref:DUF4329 domain-containing protein n=1 Tax=Parastrongyloides trichosuri TaxID=131310 RepID=A0A0N4ZL22_PARTI